MNEATTPNIIPINVPNMETTKKEPIARPTCVKKFKKNFLDFSRSQDPPVCKKLRKNY